MTGKVVDSVEAITATSVTVASKLRPGSASKRTVTSLPRSISPIRLSGTRTSTWASRPT